MLPEPLLDPSPSVLPGENGTVVTVTLGGVVQGTLVVDFASPVPLLLSLDRPSVASSVDSVTRPPANAVDSSSTTRWSSAYSDPQWLYVDLGSTRTITRVVLDWETAFAKAYEIQTSNNLVGWTTIYGTSAGLGKVEDLSGLSGSGRYVRMHGLVRATQWGYSLWDFRVYGF